MINIDPWLTLLEAFAKPTMKIIRRILLGVLASIIIATLVVAIFFRQETYQMYKVITFFEPDNISDNFRNAKNIFRTSTVPKADTPRKFPVAANPFSLPASFAYRDSVIQTKHYLEHTLTDALLIIQHDTILYEHYSNGFTAEDHHISWSMSKSVVSALLGIAIAEGKIKSIEDNVTDYLADFAGTGYENVRIKDVLQMSSGVGFNEDYGDFNSDINVLGRYFALGMPMRDFAKRLKRARPPGTYNLYVSIDTQVLGMILVQATGKSVTEYMHEKLWSKIGAESDAYWIIDNAGMEFAIGGLNATARDYAKVGQLFLDSGRWQGKQVVPASWVKASVSPDSPHLIPGKRNSAESEDGYGFQWWIPNGARDEFNAQGIYTQFIYVDPDMDMVIVKLSSNFHFTNTGPLYHDIEIELYRKIAQELAAKGDSN